MTSTYYDRQLVQMAQPAPVPSSIDCQGVSFHYIGFTTGELHSVHPMVFVNGWRVIGYRQRELIIY